MRPLTTSLAGVADQTRSAFSFLSDQWGFQSCPTIRRSPGEPRDAETVLRYFLGSQVVDTVISDITLGIFVFVGRLAIPASSQDCQEAAALASVTNFEQFLLIHRGSSLTPPFSEMKPYKTFLEMHNKAPRRYVPLVAQDFSRAIRVLAKRFETFGQECLSTTERS